MKPGSSALILEYATLGEAYTAIQALPEGIETYELIPSSKGTVLIIGGSMNAFAEIELKIPKARASRSLAKVSGAVAKAWLGLENPPLSESLTVFESDKVTDVFEAATLLENAGLTPFDLRILRGGETRAYVLATGKAPGEALTANLNGKLTVIRSPSSSLKDLFEIRAY